MKKIYTFLLATLIAVGAYAQSLPFYKRAPRQATEIKVGGKNKLGGISPLSTTQIYTSLWQLDEDYQVNTAGLAYYNNFIFELNSNAVPLDSFPTLAIVVFDSIYDGNGVFQDPSTFTSLKIDSVWIGMTRQKSASTPADSMVIKVVALEDITLGSNIAVFPKPGTIFKRVVVPAAQLPVIPNGSFGTRGFKIDLDMNGIANRFGIVVEYYGDLALDTFALAYGFPTNATAGSCAASTSSPVNQETVVHSIFPYSTKPYKANSFFGVSHYNAQSTFWPSKAGSFFFTDCNGVPGYSVTAVAPDGQYYLQDWRIALQMTLDNAGVGQKEIDAATGIKLSQNIPNPFNGFTTINYSLNEKNNVMLTVYDITGKQVMQFNEGNKLAGKYSVKIDGSKLAKGLYYYSLTAGDKTSAVKKMIITE